MNWGPSGEYCHYRINEFNALATLSQKTLGQISPSMSIISHGWHPRIHRSIHAMAFPKFPMVFSGVKSTAHEDVPRNSGKSKILIFTLHISAFFHATLSFSPDPRKISSMPTCRWSKSCARKLGRTREKYLQNHRWILGATRISQPSWLHYGFKGAKVIALAKISGNHWEVSMILTAGLDFEF